MSTQISVKPIHKDVLSSQMSLSAHQGVVFYSLNLEHYKQLNSSQTLFLGITIQDDIEVTRLTQLAHTSLHQLKKFFDHNSHTTLGSLKNAQKEVSTSLESYQHTLVIGVICQKQDHWVLYAVSQRPCDFYLYREEKLYKLPVKPDGLSGFLQKNDHVLFTDQPPLALDKILEVAKDKKNEHHIYNHSHIGLLISCVALPKLLKLNNFVKQLLPKSHSVTLAYQSEHTKLPLFTAKRRYALGLAILFLCLLLISIGIGYRKRQQKEQQGEVQQLMEDVLYRIDQAKSLKDLNPLRSRALLTEARVTLETYKKKQIPDIEVQSLEEQVNEAYAQVAKEYYISQPEVFFNLSLIKQGLYPDQMTLSEDDLTLLDSHNRSLVNLNIRSKAYAILGGEDLVQPQTMLATIPAWVFLQTNKGIKIIDKQTLDIVDEFMLKTIDITKIVGYGNNAYILDIDKGQVWRFRGIQGGLAKPEPFFDEALALQQVADIAIDGSVWLLYLDGGIEKYTSGIRDAYFPSFGLETPFNHPTQILTDENSDYLYIIDPKNLRVVVVSKSGQYQGQYIFSSLDNTTDYAISESLQKLFLLRDGMILSVDLRF